MKDITSLIFDMDGTLIDSYPGIDSSIRYVFDQLSLPQPENFRSLIGPPMKNIFSILLDSEDNDLISKCVFLYREHYSRIGVHNCQVYPGVIKFLQRCIDNKISLYVATSKIQRFADIMLTENSIMPYFSVALGTPDDGSLDDKKYLIKKLVKHGDIDISTSFLIGDRSEDIQAAQYNSLNSIHVSWGYGGKDCSTILPTFKINSFEEAENIIF